MRTTFFTIILCLIPFASQANGADDLRDLVESAIAEEVASMDDLVARFEKSKLKSFETKLLFTSKHSTKKLKIERLGELREQILAGEVSFKVLDITHPKVGLCGCMTRWVQVSQVLGDDSFLAHHSGQFKTSGGSFAGSNSGLVATLNRGGGGSISVDPDAVPLLFRGLDDRAQTNDRITFGKPLLVTGRYEYQTVAAGVRNTVIIEPLSVCVRRLADKAVKKEPNK